VAVDRLLLTMLLTGVTACGGPATSADPAPPPDPAPTPATTAPPTDRPTGTDLRAAMETIELRNDAAYVRVTPEIGRITGFGRIGEANRLWLDDGAAPAKALANDRYVNWGGDKVWPAQQTVWQRALGRQWPPDGVIDGRPWTVIERSARHVVIESRIHEQLHVQARRTIRLDDTSAEVTITNALKQVRPTPYPVTIWSVTQVARPAFGLMDADPASPLDEPWLNLAGGRFDPAWASELPTAVRYDPPTDKGTKIGAFGRWVAAVYDDGVFVQFTGFNPRAMYLDGSNLQLYADGRYMELETLSPNAHLMPGESIRNVVVWRLIDRPAGDAAAIAARIDRLVPDERVASP